MNKAGEEEGGREQKASFVCLFGKGENSETGLCIRTL